MTKVYRARGKFLMGGAMQPFVKEVRAENENHVREFLYSEFGSKHRTPRRKVDIQEIEEIEEIEKTENTDVAEPPKE